MTLSVRGLGFSYAGAPLLDGIDLDIADGEQAVVMGPSGCGKSTLLRCIAGLERPDAGTVTLAGKDVSDMPTHQRRVGLLFQEPALFPHLDVAGNVRFGLRYTDVPKADYASLVHAHLDGVGLAHRADAAVDELSGGERQRVALARTLAAKPRAILLDEPLSALDADLRESLGAQVKSRLAEAQVPALWVTHDASEARRIGDTAYGMRGGALHLVD